MIDIPQHIKEMPDFSIPRESRSPDEPIRLCFNENTLSPPESVQNFLSSGSTPINLYPDPNAWDLRCALADFTKTAPENVVAGNGSEGIMNYIFKAFLQPGDNIITASATFMGIYALALSYNIQCTRTPLNENYQFDLDGMLNAITPSTRLIYLVNPNNPTGTYYDKQAILEFVSSVPKNVLVVLDEAYYEYAIGLDPEYANFPYLEFDNLITLRTFSKAYGMAALRLGYGFAQTPIIDAINRVKLMFEPSAIAQQAGILALKERAFIELTAKRNIEGLNYLQDQLDALGIKYAPSYANFIMLVLESESSAAELLNHLKQQNILVSYLKPFNLTNCLRVTVGTMPENKIFIASLREYLNLETSNKK